MFIPLTTGRKVYTAFPIATAVIVLINLIFFGWENWLFFGQGGEAWYAAVRTLGFTPGDLVRQVGWGGVTAFSSMYLHGGPSHFFFNMLYLWVFGPAVEDLTGSARFFLFYTLAGLMGSALTLLLDAESLIPGIGASGAIAGVMGAFLLLYPSRRVRTLVFLLLVFVINIPAWILLGWWILQQAVLGQFILNYGENLTGIGVWAHIGGFIGGIVLVWLFLRQEVMFNRESVMMTGRG